MRREKNRIAVQLRRERDPEHVRAIHRASYHRRKTARRCELRDQRFQKLYGLTAAQVDALAEGQGQRCAICRELFKNSRDRHVDHNHKTGQVRAMLCCRCNTRLGMVEREDWQDFLQQAQRYLAVHAHTGVLAWKP